MSTENNKAIVRRYTEEFNKGNFDIVDEVMDANCPHPIAGPGTPPGPEWYKGLLAKVRKSLPDIQYSVKEIVAEGDRVIYCSSISGTHQGPLWYDGSPPTGRGVEWQGYASMRFENGKVVEYFQVFDHMELYRQLGITPKME